MMKRRKAGPSYRGPRIDGITNSLLQAWSTCRVLAQMKFQGWKSIRPKRAFQLGTLMHKLIEDWIEGGCRPGITSKQLIREGGDKWRTRALNAGDDLESIEHDLFVATTLMEGYAKKWSKSDREKQWVETEGVFDVNHAGYRLRGKIDGVFRYPGKKPSAWVLETKTRTTIDEGTMDIALQLDPQSLFYCLALGIKLNTQVKGLLYNVIRKPSLRQGKAESIEKFRARIREDILHNIDHYYRRFEIPFSDAALIAFHEDLRVKLGEFEQWYKNGMRPTYRSEFACSGKWACEMLPACASRTMAGYAQEGKLFGELEEEE